MKNKKIDDQLTPEVFRLKHFDILQHIGVMKVGTDSFLLGALVSVVPGTALDIGCGTGILALMLAQREPDLSYIVGIDINKEAISLATKNFRNSKWSKRLTTVHSKVQDYSLQKTTKFNLIISNPPFYTDGYLPPDKIKRLNKHTIELSFLNLLSAVTNLLGDEGHFSTIIPAEVVKEFVDIASDNDLFLYRKVEIYSRPDQLAVRNVLEFARIEVENLILRGKTGSSYSKAYLNLTKEFHLDVSSM